MGGIVDGALGGAIGTGIVGLFALFAWLPLVKTFKDPSTDRFRAMRKMLESEWDAAQRYRSTLGVLLGWVDDFFDRGAVNPSPWSARTYDRLLGLAIAYPILSAFLIWAFSGHAGTLGIAVGMTDSEDVLVRLIPLIGIFAIFIGYFLFIQFAGWKSIAVLVFAFAGALAFAFAGALAFTFAFAGAFLFAGVGASVFVSVVADAVADGDSVADGDPVVLALRVVAVTAVAAAFAVAVAVAGSVAFAFAFAVACAVAVGGALVDAVAFAGAVAVVVAVVVAVPFLSRIARDRNRYGLFLTILSIGYIVALFGTLLFLAGEQESKNDAFALLIGICLIPLINVVFDWGSIGLTRHLLRKNLHGGPGRWSTSRAALDFIIAMALLVLLAITLVSVLTLVDQIGYARGMTTAIVGVDAVLDDICGEPAAPRHWWIYFTLFSTLIPTFIHGVIWVGSLSSVRPKIVDQWILREMDEVAATEDPEDRIGHARRAAALVLVQWTVATFLVAAACYLFWTAADHLTGAGELLLTLLICVQEMTAAGAAWVFW